MKKIFSIALGILAAIGGFVDIGDIVFNVEAGATFGYQLLWAVVIGVGGIVTYAEMCGRVAAVSGRAVFDAVRERLGFGVGLVALIAGQLVNLLTLAAEVGGVALVLQLLSALSYHALVVLAAVFIFLVLWLMPFEWIERVFGYCGLALLVFVVSAIKLHPDWGAVAHGFVPDAGTGDHALYAYFIVGLVGAAMVPYEVYFYSSGAIEERWKAKDLGVNRANAVIGYALGGILSFALMISAGALLLPRGISAELLGTVSLVAGAPRFTLAWSVMLVLAFAIIITGVDPILVTELSVFFSVVALPLTYIPILLVANDRAYMGSYANGAVGNVFGIFYVVVVLVIAIAAIPLLVITNMGQG